MSAAERFWSCAAAVFDLDGTLVDTLDGLHVALNHALQEHGFAAVERRRVHRSMHGGFAATVQAALHDAPGAGSCGPAVLRSYRARYRALMVRRSAAYPAVREVLERQRARGCRLAVCTNRDEPMALELLEGLGLRPFFDVVVGSRRGVEPKPHPRALLLALQALGTAGGSALMVGDSEVDVACAAAAGVPCLVFDGGYGPDALDAGAAEGRFASYASLLRARPHAEVDA